MEWSALSVPSGTGINGGYFWVYDLQAYDEGSGSQLYAAGDFALAGGVETSNIARWDGDAWSALEGPAGNGTDQGVWAIQGSTEGDGPAIHVGGSFTSAGGLASDRFAVWKWPVSLLFEDGFELGDTLAWSATAP